LHKTPKPEENLKINGRLFKEINSGGDTIIARRNYDREIQTLILILLYLLLEIMNSNIQKMMSKNKKYLLLGLINLKQKKKLKKWNEMELTLVVANKTY
jgi:hypothetical protein